MGGCWVAQFGNFKKNLLTHTQQLRSQSWMVEVNAAKRFQLGAVKSITSVLFFH